MNDRHECDACRDTGWIDRSCSGEPVLGRAICGRRQRHQAHDFVEPCSCRPINRAYQDRVASRRVA